jgi:hypothetical protein
MDERALIRAAYITLRRVILERFPPGLNAEPGSGGFERARPRGRVLLKSNAGPAGREH